MSQNYFCIFCDNKDFFKSDLRQHIINKHMKQSDHFLKSKQIDEQFVQFIDSLINYCSKIEKTMKSKPKKCLPDNNVKQLLIGCPLCDQIIDYYQLKSFDRNEKLSKNLCICGANDVNTSNVSLITINCCLCKHLFHWECAEGEEYSGQDLSSYLCQFCRTRNFSIEICGDLKPLDQLKHFRQHFSYKPFKCIISNDCEEKFFTFPLLIDHIKCNHNYTQNMIKNSDNFYIYEKIVEIEDLLELKGIKSELTAFDFDNNVNDSIVNSDKAVKSGANTQDIINGYNSLKLKLIEALNESNINITPNTSTGSVPSLTTTLTKVTDDKSIERKTNSSTNPIPSTSKIEKQCDKPVNDSQSSEKVVIIELTTDSNDTQSVTEEMDTNQERGDITTNTEINANEETNKITTKDNTCNNDSIDNKDYKRYCVKFGHISCVYCVVFDRTGKHIITGSDDYLLKIWSSTDGRLIATLRGHLSEITDISINYENTLLASGDILNSIFIWCLKTAKLLTILKCHTKQITSLKFCPLSQTVNRYLVSTGDDGRVCFWKWNSITNDYETNPNPTVIEQHKKGSGISCSSFSSDGHLLAVGSTDSYISIYSICSTNGPKKIFEDKQHWGHVDRLHFSHNSLRFVSSCYNVYNPESNINRDNAFIWYFEKSSWNAIPIKVFKQKSGDYTYGTLIIEMAWTQNDEYIITSLTDYSIKIWRSSDAELIQVLNKHNDEIHCIQTHPIDENIFLSAGYDFKVIIWDIKTGSAIKKFMNKKGRAILDSCFSPNGRIFATTDCYGSLSIFGCDSAEPYRKTPEQLFFHTDYHPLLSTDTDSMVVDKETNERPHLLPIPFLVNFKGLPYHQKQRLVPGRENCSDFQNEPYVCVFDFNRFVLEPVIKPANSLQSSPNKPNRLPLSYKCTQLLDILTKHMSHKEMFDTLFINYIKLPQIMTGNTARNTTKYTFLQLLIKLVTNRIDFEKFYDDLNELIPSPPREFYLPVLKGCLPRLKQNPSNDKPNGSAPVSPYDAFRYILNTSNSKPKNSSTSDNYSPNNVSNQTTVTSLNSITNSLFNPSNSSNDINQTSTQHLHIPQDLPQNIMQCHRFLSLKLLLGSIQPQKVTANVTTLIQALIDDVIEVDHFINKIKEELNFQILNESYSQFLKETLPEFRFLMFKNEIQLEGITAPPLLPPNNLLFKPKQLMNSEHNYYNPRYEESIDRRTIFLRDKNVDKSPYNEKGWKVAKKQLLRRPGNWVSYGIQKSLDSVWTEREAVTQLTNEELKQTIERLNDKELNEIKIYDISSIKRQLESDLSSNDGSISMNNINNSDNTIDDMSAGPSEPSVSRILRMRTLPSTSCPSEPPSKRLRSGAQVVNEYCEALENPFEEWSKETRCLKRYYPQIGDEVVYLRVGHQEYINAIRSRTLNIIGSKQYKYNDPQFKDYDNVFAKVIDITYELKPIPNVRLKLAEIHPNTNQSTINFFQIRYNRIEGISDFIILKQLYDKSIEIFWKSSDSFRTTTSCGNFWTFGTVLDVSPYSKRLPESQFKLYIVNMTDNDVHRLSPWDLEPIDYVNYPDDRCNVPIINDERFAFYEPKPDDWPHYGREVECNRLEKGFTRLMELRDVSFFTFEGNIFNNTDIPQPIYPINLSIITERIKNRFYRRSEHIKYDIRLISTNVEKYLYTYNFHHENYSEIDSKAKLVTEVCLKFIDKHECDNPIIIYDELLVDEVIMENMRIKGETCDTKSYLKCFDHEKQSFKKLCVQSVSDSPQSYNNSTDQSEDNSNNEGQDKTNNESKDDSSSGSENKSSDQSEDNSSIEIEDNSSNESEDNSSDIEILEFFDNNVTEETRQINANTMETNVDNETEPELQTETQFETEVVTDVQNVIQLPVEIVTQIQKQMQSEVETETQNEMQSEVGTDNQNEIPLQVEIRMETDVQNQPEIPSEIRIKTEINDDIQRVDCETQTGDIELQTHVKIEIKPEIKSETLEEDELSEEVQQYFCIFCRQNFYFFDRTEAFEHYRQHLKTVLKCNICYSTFVDMKTFKSHNTEHSRNADNLINVKNYKITLFWINSFLDFQSTEKFKHLARNCREFCPVCHVIKTNYRLLIRNNDNLCDIFGDDLSDEESFAQHIRKHLKCEKVFQCLKCENNGSNEQKSNFSFDLEEAQNHLLATHPSDDLNPNNIYEITINEYFNVSQTLSPKLQTFIDKLQTISDSIQDLDEIYSID